MNDLAPAPPPADKFRNFLAAALIVAFISMLPLLVWKTIPDSNKEIIVYMIGQLSGMAATAIGFYFISKAGEAALDTKRAENTGKLADAITAATAATPAPQQDVASEAAGKVADAAADKADEIKGGDS